MEESKAAEYYEELTRKGEGAARFKQGLGFGSGSSTATNHENNFPVRGSALPSSSSSFLSSFVRASSPSKTSEFEKEAQLKNIQSKLRKKPDREPSSARVSDRRNGDRSRSRERDSRSRRPSTSRYRDRDRDRDRRSRRSRSDSDEDRRRRERRRSRSVSPSARREKVEKKEKVDYSKLIEGYGKMVCFFCPKSGIAFLEQTEIGYGTLYYVFLHIRFAGLNFSALLLSFGCSERKKIVFIAVLVYVYSGVEEPSSCLM